MIFALVTNKIEYNNYYYLWVVTESTAVDFYLNIMHVLRFFFFFLLDTLKQFSSV